MAQKLSKKTELLKPVPSHWDDILGALAVLLVVLVPFLPDEKIVRLKMQGLELGVFFLLAVAVLRWFWSSQRPFFLSRASAIRRFFLSVIVWMIVQSVLYVLSSEKSLAANEWRRVCLGGCAFLAFALAEFNEIWIQRILTAWGLTASLLGLYGVLQVRGGLWFIQVPQMERVMATYGNPIFFASYLVASIFVTGAACFKLKKGWMRTTLWVGIVFQCAALYHTETRAAWIAFAVALICGGLYLRKNTGPAWLYLLVLVSLGVFGWQTKNVWSRDQGHLLIWRDTLRMWKDHPAMGVGMGAFHTRFPSYAQDDLKAKWPQGQTIINYAHNEYLQVLAETGLVGFLGFVAVLLLYIWWVRGVVARSRENLVLSLAVIALLVQNLFSVDMRFGISFATLFVLMGLLFSKEVTAESGEPSVVSSGSPVVRYGVSGAWVLFLALVGFPKVMQPYRAQKIVSATAGFFNERLLDPAKSIQDLETLAKEYPDEPLVLEKLAYVYAKEMKTKDDRIDVGRAEAAIQTYERLLVVDPKRASAVNNIANINYTMGRQDDAIRLWRKCLEIDPNFLDAHLNLGKTLYVKGELKESAAHLEAVLRINPGNPEAIVYLKRMVE